MDSGTPIGTNSGELSLTLAQPAQDKPQTPGDHSDLTPWQTDYNLNKFALSYPDWVTAKNNSELVEQLDRAHITPETTYPILSGGCAYIYKGTWQRGQEVLPVSGSNTYLFTTYRDHAGGYQIVAYFPG